MLIDNINTEKDILVIAEIGNNHEGSLKQAIKLIKGVATTGAQAVKFQTFITEHFVSPENPQRYEQLKKFELSQDEFRELAHVAKNEGLIFLSTPFDIESALFLNDLVPAFKIGSAENTFYPLLTTVAKCGKPIILSTGCADIQIITQALKVIDQAKFENQKSAETAILHCITSYPTTYENCNLAAITQIKSYFPNCTVGYSDHTLGIDASLYAIALGAKIIEKHFTLDKDYSNFHDHKISATPNELSELISKARNVQVMLGDGIKTPRDCEIEIEQKIRRAICAKSDIEAGQIITEENLCWTRPIGDGLAPGSESKVLGKKTSRRIKKGERIMPSLLD